MQITHRYHTLLADCCIFHSLASIRRMQSTRMIDWWIPEAKDGNSSLNTSNIIQSHQCDAVVGS